MIKETRPVKDFLPFPAYTDRQSWNALPENIKSLYHAGAAEIKGREWPSLPAALYLEYYRNGDRSRFQANYFKRRVDLFTLIVAECIEAKGEYIDEIINGVWLICEETTWVIPAHINHDRSGQAPVKELPDIEEKIYIDLFSAETGSLLSWVYYFLGDAIASRAPMVKRRLELEVERRLLVPYLQYDYFQWMGLGHNDPVNNWNPWINSNMLVCFLIFAKTFPAAADGAAKTIRSANRFLHFYADDGGCDEGPGYFGKAGASLFDFVEELGQVADVSYLYRKTKIRNIASYIYKVYVGKTYYVNYADAAPSVNEPVELLERVGKNTGDETLLAYTAHLRANPLFNPDVVSRNAFSLYRALANIFGAVKPAVGPAFKAPQVSWFEGIQVVTARDNKDGLGGLFFSAKGGNNNESHNHNDVGNFLLYCDETPVLVDAGVEEYTKFTFSEKRYTLWTMRSIYHNTPTINGQEQQPGAEYRARDVSFTSSGGVTRFSLDIGAAYPASANIQSYRREFVLNHGADFTMTDTYILKECTTPLTLNLLCYEKPEFTGDKILFSGKVLMEFDAPAFDHSIEKITLTDHKMHNDWNKDHLYCLRISKREKSLTGEVKLRFTPGP